MQYGKLRVPVHLHGVGLIPKDEPVTIQEVVSGVTVRTSKGVVLRLGFEDVVFHEQKGLPDTQKKVLRLVEDLIGTIGEARQRGLTLDNFPLELLKFRHELMDLQRKIRQGLPLLAED